MRLRKLTKMQTVNDGTRSLTESIMAPQVIIALQDWVKSSAPGVLIGGLAVSYYAKPRYTDDITFIFSADAGIPNEIAGFVRPGASRKAHPAAKSDTSPRDNPWFGKDYGPSRDATLSLANEFCHRRTGVEVNITTAASSKVPKEIVERIVDTATVSDGIRVASAAGLVAFKLLRFSAQDRADIAALVAATPVDLSGFSLPSEMVAAFDALVREANR